VWPVEACERSHQCCRRHTFGLDQQLVQVLEPERRGDVSLAIGVPRHRPATARAERDQDAANADLLAERF
jgi:hypothetical protein